MGHARGGDGWRGEDGVGGGGGDGGGGEGQRRNKR